jgi:hypothetical protein
MFTRKWGTIGIDDVASDNNVSYEIFKLPIYTLGGDALLIRGIRTKKCHSSYTIIMQFANKNKPTCKLNTSLNQRFDLAV